MSRKPATHRPAPQRPAGVNLFALPQGGFLIRDPMWREALDFGRGEHVHNHGAASFSTLEEALEWLRANMARPAQEPKPEVGR